MGGLVVKAISIAIERFNFLGFSMLQRHIERRPA
jgi:hypothetical protein